MSADATRFSRLSEEPHSFIPFPYITLCAGDWDDCDFEFYKRPRKFIRDTKRNYAAHGFQFTRRGERTEVRRSVYG